MRRFVLRIDALFLTVAGVFGLVSDLQSHVSGTGPFGQTFYRNPTVIGVVEAHGLAVLIAGTLWFLATHHTGRVGHAVGLIAHAIMGGATSSGSRCSRACRQRLKAWQSRWCILSSLPSTHSSSSSEPASARIEGAADWFRLVLGLFLVFGLFHGSATILGSDRGQRGILVAILVVTATAMAEVFLLRRQRGAVRRLGLGRPRSEGMVVAAGTASLLLMVGLLFVLARGLTPAFYPGWISLLPGLFAQAGIAEEVLFRGYLFGHVRVGRTFWRAAAVSMLPFVGVHLVLFMSMPWPIAFASVLLAVVISFPLAYLFELGGDTVWAPAFLHFVIQATVKVVVFAQGVESFAFAWIVASVLVPLLIFIVRAPTRR